MGRHEFVLAGEIEPDLEQFHRVRLQRFKKRKHLTMNDAAARGEPLGIAPTESRGGAK